MLGVVQHVGQVLQRLRLVVPRALLAEFTGSGAQVGRRTAPVALPGTDPPQVGQCPCGHPPVVQGQEGAAGGLQGGQRGVEVARRGLGAAEEIAGQRRAALLVGLDVEGQ